MIDEWFDAVVDRLCIAVPRHIKPWITRISGSGLGWRIYLYASSLGHVIAGAFGSISSEESVDSFLTEAIEGGTPGSGIRGMADTIRGNMMRLSLRLDGLRLPAVLFLMALSVLGVLAAGGRLMAACAAAMGLFFLAEGMEGGYAPVCRGVRQRCLFTLALRTGGSAALLLAYYGSYARQQVTTNVVLQSAMLVMLFLHGVFFLTMAAFNRRQPLLLRLLSGILGTLWALCAAAAVALAASQLAAPIMQLAAAIGIAAGSMLLLLAQELDMVMQLGAIRLRYGRLWQGLFWLTGLTLSLLGAWTAAF